MDILERARRYVEKAESPRRAANDSQDSHSLVFSVAVALIQGFELHEDDARQILQEYCSRSDQPWTKREIDHKINQAQKAGSTKPRGYLIGTQGKGSQGPAPRSSTSTAAAAVDRHKKRNEFDPAALQAMMCRGFKPDYQWLAEISPIDVRNTTPAQYLDAILEPGEKTLIIYQYYSQGQYGYHAGMPGQMYRLGERRSTRPVPVDNIEPSGREGAWYLPNPIDGKWKPTGKVDDAGNPVLSRRLGDNITAYRYLLLESDEADESFWLNLICQLPLPITALYTSGSRSVHSLIRIDAESKSEFDAIRERLTPLLSKLGADPGAISAVRLTRLPGILRLGKQSDDGYVKFPQPRLQRLLYLNPNPTTDPLKTMTRIREVEAQ